MRTVKQRSLVAICLPLNFNPQQALQNLKEQLLAHRQDMKVQDSQAQQVGHRLLLKCHQ